MSLPMETGFAQILRNAFEKGDSEFESKTLEQENISSLQNLLDTLLRADLDSFANLCSPDVEMEIFCPQQFPFIKRARGKDELKKAVAHNFSVVEDQEPDLLSAVAQGDTIILVNSEKGKIRDTKEDYDLYFMQQYTIGDGLITHFRQIVSFSE